MAESEDSKIFKMIYEYLEKPHANVMLAICCRGCVDDMVKENSVEEGVFGDCKSLLGGTSCMFCDTVHNEGLGW